MRCTACNVDLGEDYTKCPLCGSKASEEAALLCGIETAAYPKYDREKLLAEKNHHRQSFPYLYIFTAALAVSLIFTVLAFFVDGASALWSFGVPSALAACSALCFITGLTEKSKLLHSAGYLIGTAAVMAVVLFIALIAKSGITAALIGLLVCVVLFFAMWLIKPKRMKLQLQALFFL